MNGHDFWPIIERDHQIQNPTSPDKLTLLADYCRIDDGTRVLDVGCGKGWLLRSWAEAWEIEGTGLEINPTFVAEAEAHAAADGLDEKLRFVEGPALSFEPDEEGYDVVLCIGATFALGPFDETIRWMRRALRPGGTLAVGEAFFRHQPPADVVAAGIVKEDEYLQLHDILGELERQRLELTGVIASNVDEWDHYYSQWWRAAREWRDDHPGDPRGEEIGAWIARERANYFRWERHCLGWGIFVARPMEE